MDVIEVTSGVAKMHHLLAEEKGIELDCNCELDVTRRELDVDKWLQILTNLLGNAIKFTEQGEVSLRIRNHEEFDDWLVAVVQDDGPGIPVENWDRIFEPFGLMKDDDASVKNRHHVPSGSTGLGLSIARELAELMGGDLKVVPSEKGAVFELAIPAPVWHEDDGERRSSHDGSGTNDVSVPEWDGPSMDILLAEDNDINVLYARALLERWGMKVSLAKDGLEALDLWEKGTFDLVLARRSNAHHGRLGNSAKDARHRSGATKGGMSGRVHGHCLCGQGDEIDGGKTWSRWVFGQTVFSSRDARGHANRVARMKIFRPIVGFII